MLKFLSPLTIFLNLGYNPALTLQPDRPPPAMTPQPSAAAHHTLDRATIDETLATIFAAQRVDPARTPAQHQSQREAAAAFIAALQPRDPVEAAYAGRAVAAHYGSMECFRRAMLPDVPVDAGIRWLGKAVALSRMMMDDAHAASVPSGGAGRATPAAGGGSAGGPASRVPAFGHGRGGPTRRCHPSAAGRHRSKRSGPWHEGPHAQ